MARIAKYCTQAMLNALTELKRTGQQVPAPLYHSIMSRGWINRQGDITPKGVDYLASRGYSNESI